MLKEAVAQHENNWDVQVEYAAGRYRDHDIPTLTWDQHGPSGVHRAESWPGNQGAGLSLERLV